MELPAQLRIEPASAGVARADYVFLAVPSSGLGEVIEALDDGRPGQARGGGVGRQGSRPAGGAAADERPQRALRRRTASPAWADRRTRRRWCTRARRWSRPPCEEELARALAQVFTRAGVVCEQSNDPLGVELAGAAKNAAALAAGATEAQGLNAAGAAAGHIFAEVWRYAEGLGARPESMIGLAGAGDLVATALARESRNRRAGELLAAGVPAAEIPAQIGQAVEALESVPLLGRALERAGVQRAGHERAGPADLRRAAARRVGRAGARDGAPAGAVAPAPAAGVLAAGVAQARTESAIADPDGRRRSQMTRGAPTTSPRRPA